MTETPNTGITSRQQQIAAAADLCVQCGLCLPACPTYRISQQESESPRGRIAIMQALATNALSPSLDSISHLEHCFSCGNCETLCPAQVPYAKLLQQTRDSISESTHSHINTKLRRLVQRSPWQRKISNLIFCLRQYGISALFTLFTFLIKKVFSKKPGELRSE